MSADLSSPGKRIRFFREESKGLTQGALGDIVHACQASVSLWERDKRIPPKLIRQQLAELFGVSIEFLFAPADKKEEVAA